MLPVLRPCALLLHSVLSQTDCCESSFVSYEAVCSRGAESYHNNTVVTRARPQTEAQDQQQHTIKGVSSNDKKKKTTMQSLARRAVGRT